MVYVYDTCLTCTVIIMGNMTVNLGRPYEEIMDEIIEKEYAGSRTEVLRQALVTYKEKLDYEELVQVNRAAEAEMLKAGKERTYTQEEVEKELGIK